MDVSIIIVSWNTRDILRNCLKSVYEQTKNITFEVILIDNASSDGTAEMVRNEFPHVNLIKNSQNRGFAAANNQGMKIARGKYILLLNPDTIILNAAINKTLVFAEQNPEAGVIGCQAFWPDGRRQNTCFKFPSLKLVAIASLCFFRMAKPFHIPLLHPDRYLNYDFNLQHDVDIVAGCFFLIRKNVIEKVGMFDEQFFMYGEEAEWCYRIQKAGWRIRYFPDAHIVHIYGASSSQVQDDARINVRRGNLLFLHKTKGPLTAWIANLFMTVGVLFRMPFWLIRDLWDTVANKKLPPIWKKRFKIIIFHNRGLFWPSWL